MRLIDADALKEKAVHYSETEYHFEHDAVEIDDIDDAPTVEPASPWHRVEDELPSENEVVIAYGALGDIISATYDKAWGWQDDTGSFKIYGVTHWMPIEPPKEDEHGN